MGFKVVKGEKTLESFDSNIERRVNATLYLNLVKLNIFLFIFSQRYSYQFISSISS